MVPEPSSGLDGEVRVQRLPGLLAVLRATANTNDIATAHAICCTIARESVAAATPPYRELLQLVSKPLSDLGRQVHFHRLRWLFAVLRATSRSFPATATSYCTGVFSAAATSYRTSVLSATATTRSLRRHL